MGLTKLRGWDGRGGAWRRQWQWRSDGRRGGGSGGVRRGARRRRPPRVTLRGQSGAGRWARRGGSAATRRGGGGLGGGRGRRVARRLAAGGGSSRRAGSTQVGGEMQSQQAGIGGTQPRCGAVARAGGPVAPPCPPRRPRPRPQLPPLLRRRPPPPALPQDGRGRQPIERGRRQRPPPLLPPAAAPLRPLRPTRARTARPAVNSRRVAASGRGGSGRGNVGPKRQREGGGGGGVAGGRARGAHAVVVAVGKRPWRGASAQPRGEGWKEGGRAARQRGASWPALPGVPCEGGGCGARSWGKTLPGGRGPARRSIWAALVLLAPADPAE